MNNNTFKEIWHRLFRSGNPAMFYVGLNALIFLATALIGLFTHGVLGSGGFDALLREYFGFPAAIGQWGLRFYTVATYAFLHYNFFHILFNLLWLYWMGNLFLDFLKPRQFQTVYWGGVLSGAILFALIFNLAPNLRAEHTILIGASAAVMAIFGAIATLIPNYSIRLLIFGNVKLKYLLLVYVIIDVLGASSGASNMGGNIAHLGGVLFGFTYIRLLQRGTDLSRLRVRKPKMKVVRNEQATKKSKKATQQEIDAILDKISKSGYKNLTAQEKQTLFDASKE